LFAAPHIRKDKSEAARMIGKTQKKSREFLEEECVRIANAQIDGRGTERVTIKRLFLRGGPNWDVDEIYPQLSSDAENQVRVELKKLSGRFALSGN
jgi:hypothetical protein